ncbi:MAG: CarD family transcriptional regulator [Clostridiales bacterium]|nr:CarD family transcriptional regulator [Clostridiales bacterium]
MFRINDTILYGLNGACKIIDITKREVGGCIAEYYVLQPIFSNASTIFVPISNENLTSRMRQVLSAEEIHELIQSMPREESVWIEDEGRRREVYKEILSNGDRRELIRLIKALHLHQQDLQRIGRRLHMSDERFLKDAERLLYDEFALVLRIKPDQVLPFILKQINSAQEHEIA